LIPLLWDDTPFDIPLDLVADTEADATNEFVEYYELEETPIATLDEIRDQLRTVETQTGIKPAILYLIYGATEVPANPSESVSQSKSIETSNNPFQPRTIWEFNAQGWGTNLELLGQQTPNWQQGSDRLELILVTPEAPPIRQVVPNSSRQQVEQLTRRLQRTINQPNRSAAYLSTAQALYNLLIRPISEELKSLEIEHISFVADAGLRSLPFAALHDGERFIIENYSVGLMPSVSLTDLRYTNLQTLPVLATGAENFIDQPSLPAVPRELEIIATETRSGQILLNEDFTLANLQAARQVQPYPIVHLATHGEFRSGQPEDSFIVLRNEQLALDEVRTLRFYDPLVELLVLSACQTALGDYDAEFTVGR
jgi:CHAT domain-containing protein